MKVKRVKHYRKTIDIYDAHFGLETNPLEILVDSTFARQALVQQLHIEQQFQCTLSCEFSLVTTSCVVSECESLGQLFHGALCILKGYKVLKCTHKINPNNSAFSCIKKRIRTAGSKKWSESNAKKRSLLFAVATNDESLQQHARAIPGMPIFYVAHRRINMESMPEEVALLLKEKATKALGLTCAESTIIKQLGDRFGFSEVKPIRRKKTKGPNPLSCKRKARETPAIILSKPKRKRKRKRIKVTWAMKQAIEELKSKVND
ncbi:unnamed protein product [Trichobilharzia szidati]|nr:unnamed protein product [Trichobilharzia szidati]